MKILDFGLGGLRTNAPLPYGIYTIPEISIVLFDPETLRVLGVPALNGFNRLSDGPPR